MTLSLRTTWCLLLCWQTVIFSAFSAAIIFCPGGTFAIWLFVLNFIFSNYFGLRFRAGQTLIPAQQQALNVSGYFKTTFRYET
jgi:hypothetical protein